MFVLASCIAAGFLIYPRAALPLTVRMVSGAVVFSTLIFFTLLAGVGTVPVFAGIGVTMLGAAVLLLRRAWVDGPFVHPRGPGMNWFFRGLFGFYVIVYSFYVLAPEIQPDAVTYHLGLVSEYVRLAGFPDRVGFYEMLPQGVEMLFVPAVAIAGYGGAKAVHFGFLLALIPLVRALGLELGLTNKQACGAAAILFFAPVLGVAGTSAYTDAALLCCLCSCMLLLARWTRDPRTAFLVHASLGAGFCYVVKPTLGWAAALAFSYVVWRAPVRRYVAASVMAGIVVVTVAPWMVRALVMADNPFAPFLNGVFPNEWFHRAMDVRLASEYSAFRGGFSWWRAPLDYSVLGGNQGTLGPVLLLLPLAVLARGKRWLLVVAALLMLPWILNTGTRFLLPAALMATLALMAAVPDRFVAVLVFVQALISFPAVLPLYQKSSDWRLAEIPARVVFGMENPRDYLVRHIDNYDATEMVQARTSAGSRVFSLAAAQQAYTDREVLMMWSSAVADDLTAGIAKAFKEGDFKREATAPIRRAGYRYLLVATADDPFAGIGRDMVRYPQEWNLILVGVAGNEVLFYVNAMPVRRK